MLTPASWIHTDGRHIDVGTSHIRTVINNNDQFDVTLPWLRSVYEKHGEADRFGCEGSAREEVILYLVEQGWIRTRLCYKPSYYWSITARDTGSDIKSTLIQWADSELTKGRLKNTSEVRIYLPGSGDMIVREAGEMTDFLRGLAG